MQIEQMIKRDDKWSPGKSMLFIVIVCLVLWWVIIKSILTLFGE